MTARGGVLILLLAACGNPRPVEGTRRCLTWKEDIAPRLGDCKRCHEKLEHLDFVDGAAFLDDGNHDLPLRATLRKWIVECELAYSDTPVHPRGLMNPSSDEFHGKELKRTSWNFDACRKCHGDDLSGGKSGASCWTCHSDGPTGCTTCHGQPPKSGAHQAHALSPTLEKPTACAICHPIPTDWAAAGHLDDVVHVKVAGWDAPTASCSDVSCHSGVATPSWRDGKLACGGCHTLPPSTHPEPRCVGCHPKVVDLERNLVDKRRHLDGKVSLGDESGEACTACHRTLSGKHAVHLAAPHKISKPLECAACHTVPATVLAPAHGDGAVQVGECARCHGAPVQWTDPPVFCGSCHGVPPADARHAGTTLATCYTCHSSTMNASGALLPDAHVNGVVDAQ